MSIPMEEYTEKRVRTQETLKKCSKLSSSRPAKERLGSQQAPLLSIDPDHIVLDELHLLLRILDILIRNLIYEMVRLDTHDSQRASRSRSASVTHLQQLISTVRECGLSFNVWEKQDGDRKLTGKYDWTSLTGREKKHLLATLPDKLPTLLPADIASVVCQLWKVCKQHISTQNIHVPYHYTTNAYRILRLSTS